MAVLDSEGLLYLWNKIKNVFATKESVASDIKALQDSIGAMGGGDMMKATYDKNNDGIVDNAEKVGGFTVGCDVPADAKFTDTTYTHPTFLGSTKQLGLYKVELNSSGHVTSVTTVNKSDITDLGIPSTNTTYNVATASSSGLMSSSMYSKLNALPTNDTLATTYATNSSVLNIRNDLDDNYMTAQGISTNYVSKTSLTSTLSSYAKSSDVSSTYATKTSLDSYAKKTDLANVYIYKGSVASESALPTSGMQVGWVYDISSASSYGGAGMNVAWNGTSWDALGEVFRVASITNSEIDTICS